MSAPKMISFALWCLTGWMATICVLGSLSTGHQAVAVSVENPAVQWSVDNVAAVFRTPESLSPSPITTPQVKLLGIMLSDNAAQSRALIQEGNEAPKSRGLHAALKDGGTITKIEKRAIEIKQASEIFRLQLPR